MDLAEMTRLLEEVSKYIQEQSRMLDEIYNLVEQIWEDTKRVDDQGEIIRIVRLRIGEILLRLDEIEGVKLSELSVPLPSDCLNVLQKGGITTVEEVLHSSPERLLSLRNFGPRRISILEDILIQNGYSIPWKRVAVERILRDPRGVQRFSLNISWMFFRFLLKEGFSSGTLESLVPKVYGRDWWDIRIGSAPNGGTYRILEDDLGKEDSYFIKQLRRDVRMLMTFQPSPERRISEKLAEVLSLMRWYTRQELKVMFIRLGIWPKGLD